MLSLEHYKKKQTLQALWSGYGHIDRYVSSSKEPQSIIVKEIHLEKVERHPRGWNSQISHQRKLSSYQNEVTFYKHYSNLTTRVCKVPAYLGSQQSEKHIILQMEDLDGIGFSQRRLTANVEEAKLGLRWLAHFHARFLGVNLDDLWPIASYWHLATRPEEFEAMSDCDLKMQATTIDKILNAAQYQSMVHGDAKLANFCFHESLDSVAAVDFQYVGRGSPVKDVAYFIGSCFFDDELEKYADALFEFYLNELLLSLQARKIQLNASDFEGEIRYLYPFAWADFERFLMGWSPTHKKLSTYSHAQSERALNQLRN